MSAVKQSRSTKMAQIEAKLSQERQVLTQTEDEIKRLEEDLRVEKENETNKKKRSYAKFMEKPEDDTALNSTYLPEKLDNVIHVLEKVVTMAEGDLSFYRKRKTGIGHLLAVASRTPLPFHRFTFEEIKTLDQLDSFIDSDSQRATEFVPEEGDEPEGEDGEDGEDGDETDVFWSMIRKAKLARVESWY